MGRLILVRHGETEENKKGVFFGWLDPSLNETGVVQGYEAKKKLEKYNYSKIYSSPLKRAFETCEIINYKKIPVQVVDDIKELNFGIFEGYSYEEIVQKYPTQEKIASENWQEYHFETGESPKSLQERVVKFVEENLDLQNEDTVLVTHWGVICSILSYYLSKELDSYWKFKIKNGGIAVLEFSDGYVMLEEFV